MLFKDLLKVLPAYTTVYVHNQDHDFAHKGNPHEFTMGMYQNLRNWTVIVAVPLDSYIMEVTIKEASK